MGCDIHLFTELKINGTWHAYGNPHIQRNYALFAKMAGVRGEEEPIAEPRGLPDDVSVVAALESAHDGVDGHSHSYLTSGEIKTLNEWWDTLYDRPGSKVEQWFESHFGYLSGNGWCTESLPAGATDFRFVFWFDN